MFLVYEFSCKSKHFILFKRINVPLFAVTFLLFPFSLLFQVQNVSHAFFLGLKITQVVLVGTNFNGYVLYYFKPISL